MSEIRVRIAPSPTGPLHIGTARTALFNALFARHHGGAFILRLEDTDVARSTSAFEADILGGLHWLGITWDEGPDSVGGDDHGPYGPYRQMQRLQRYAAAAADLLARDLAYPCYCTPDELEADRTTQEAARQPPRYVGRCAALTAGERAARVAEGRTAVTRFRVPPGVIGFEDAVRGRIEIDTANLGGDFVIVRADGTPLYHFVVVVDDAAMEISHIIRGEDHISNTPKHILLFRALGHAEPVFAHLPLILNPDRTKMSKRKSQTAISDYIAQGFIREALVNYLALLGWSTGTEEEILSFDELAARFDLDHVQKGGAVFDRERLPTLGAVGDLIGFLWVDDLRADPATIVPKRWEVTTTSAALADARRVIADVGAVSFESEEIEPPLRALAEARGWKAGDLFMAIRVAVTGRTATPPLFDTLVALGRERTLARLDAALAGLTRLAAAGAPTPANPSPEGGTP